MRPLRTHLSYANVMSTIAVFLVLGGGAAFAATQLAKNSVGPKQLKKNAVTGAKIKKDAVTGEKVKDGSLSGADINAATLGTVPNAANAANAATLAGSPPSAFGPPPMWALVDKSGVIVRQSGGIQVAPVLKGVVQVVFPQTVEGRAISATRALMEGDLTGYTTITVGACTMALDCSKFEVPNEPRRVLVASGEFEKGPPATFSNAEHAFWIVAD